METTFESLSAFETINNAELEVILGGNVPSDCSRRKDVDCDHGDSEK